jgi:UDP-glucose 4-epimerase
MKILVTGGAGYIGSGVVRMLGDRGVEVVVLDSMEFGHKNGLGNKARLVEGNVGDEVLLDKLGEEKFDGVLHFAGYIQAGESVTLPQKYLENNVVRSSALLRMMVKFNIRKIIFSSTAAVYGEPEYVPIDEMHPKKPTNPYGLSKWHFEELLDYYDRKHGIKGISLRYFNASGARLDGLSGEAHAPETHVIPLALRAAELGGEMALFGTDYPTEDGTCVRDYIHVEDLAEAHCVALDALVNGHDSDQFNLGTGKGLSNRQVLKEVEKTVGKPLKVVEKARREGDPHTLVANANKIKKDLGWEAKYSDMETIVKTAWEWEKKLKTIENW